MGLTLCEKAVYWFFGINNIHAKFYGLVINEFGNFENFFNNFDRTSKKLSFLSDNELKLLSETHSIDFIENSLNGLLGKGINVLTIESGEYFKLLKQIDYPPVLLYYRGSFDNVTEKFISIVGSRRATDYGTGFASNIARDLADCGITIVSGLAYGIDAAAHKGALSVNGKTIAVLGNSLDVCYPPDHAELFEKIANSGMILS